jgi:hypothetical protein
MSRLISAAVALVALGAFLGAGSAAAEAPSVTVAGNATNAANTPGSDTIDASLHATLADGQASGEVRSEGREGGAIDGTWKRFEGDVTCVLLRGKRVTVGAFGVVVSEPLDGFEAPTQLPGQYAQLFTVEFGLFANHIEVGGPPYSDSYGLLGPNREGVPADAPPSCEKASFAHQLEPTSESVIQISPAITAPVDGRMLRPGLVRIAGSAEPDGRVAVTDADTPGLEVQAPVKVNGRWIVELERLAPGPHAFTAHELGASTVPSNTVEVSVR